MGSLPPRIGAHEIRRRAEDVDARVFDRERHRPDRRLLTEFAELRRHERTARIPLEDVDRRQQVAATQSIVFVKGQHISALARRAVRETCFASRRGVANSAGIAREHRPASRRTPHSRPTRRRPAASGRSRRTIARGSTPHTAVPGRAAGSRGSQSRPARADGQSPTIHSCWMTKSPSCTFETPWPVPNKSHRAISNPMARSQ